jgi:hypothetical protein
MADVSKDNSRMTAGLDIGDNYSYLCASSINKVVRFWRRVGCSLPPRPSGDAFARSSLLCASP